MDPVAMWIGYAVMTCGAFAVCFVLVIVVALLTNKATRMALGAFGGWEVFLKFREWYNNERLKVGDNRPTDS